MARLLTKNFHPNRSGDIYRMLNPHVFSNIFSDKPVISKHSSHWRYGTFVPVIFAGAGLMSRRVHRSVTPYGVAPTLASFLGMKPSSGASGEALVEFIA